MKKILIDIKDNEAISSRKLFNKKKSFLIYFQKIKHLKKKLKLKNISFQIIII